jgi:hypothetical protein
MTTGDLINDMGIAMQVGTLPVGTPNPSLPGNEVLVAS